VNSISTSDALIRHWLITGRPIIGAEQSANYWLIPIFKKLNLLSYFSYLFRLRLLYKDSYLLEGLQSADKTKTHPKAKLQNAPTFTGNGTHSHVCLLLVKTCTYKLCKRQSADTNILIGQYQLSAKRRILGRYWLSTDYWRISNLATIRSSTHLTYYVRVIMYNAD